MENQSNYYPDQQVSIPDASAVLVLGIISIVTCCCCMGIIGIICSIVAIIMYKNSIKVYNENPSLYKQSSLSNLNAGRICAIIGLILSLICVLAVIAMVIELGTEIFTNPERFLDEIKSRGY